MIKKNKYNIDAVESNKCESAWLDARQTFSDGSAAVGGADSLLTDTLLF